MNPKHAAQAIIIGLALGLLLVFARFKWRPGLRGIEAETSTNTIEVPEINVATLSLRPGAAMTNRPWEVPGNTAVANLPPLQSLMIGDSQIFTNIVISNSQSARHCSGAGHSPPCAFRWSGNPGGCK